MIQDKTMLVELIINKWGNTKYDRKVSQDIELMKSAHDAGRYNKALVDKKHLADINSIAAQCRAYHYSRTLAWADRGQRILPGELFMEYRDEIKRFQTEYTKAVHTFIAQWPTLVADARKHLGQMYDPEDYPSSNELLGRFDIRFEISPVPTADDFRVALAQEAVDEVKQQITESINHKIVDATRECWTKAREVLERISAQCGNEKGRIYDSSMESARDLVNILSGLNITNNPDVTQLERDIRSLIRDTDVIRANPHIRKDVADSADKILANFPWR